MVREVFDRIVRGESLRHIAADLDEKRAAGRRWFASHLSAILRRKVYKSGAPADRIVDPRVWNRANRVVEERRPRATTGSA